MRRFNILRDGLTPVHSMQIRASFGTVNAAMMERTSCICDKTSRTAFEHFKGDDRIADVETRRNMQRRWGFAFDDKIKNQMRSRGNISAPSSHCHSTTQTYARAVIIFFQDANQKFLVLFSYALLENAQWSQAGAARAEPRSTPSIALVETCSMSSSSPFVFTDRVELSRRMTSF